MSTLGFFTQSVVTNFQSAYYNMCLAKFMAERASDVGKNSFLTETRADGMIIVDFDSVEDAIRLGDSKFTMFFGHCLGKAKRDRDLPSG